jgi:VWFA-related protein
MAMVVDDLGLSFDSVVHVRDSLKKWVDNEMLPGDLVAIVRTSAGMGSLQRFTMDKLTLHAAIDRIDFHLGRVGVSSFGATVGPLPTDGVLDTRIFEDEARNAYLTGSISAIQNVVRGLRDLPGRKSLILFSESMKFTALQGGLVDSQVATKSTNEEYLRKLADEANRSSVVIYAVDPRGVVYTGGTAADAGAADRTTELIESRDGMHELTERTGGLFVRDSNDVGSMLSKAVDDGDGYYLIAYQPESTTFDDGTGKTKFHSIQVNVKRPGLSVRSRSGFLGTPDNRPGSTPSDPRAQLVSALTSPFATGDIRVHLTGLFYSSETEGPFVRTFSRFDADSLTFTEAPDGFQLAELDFVAMTFDAEGEQVSTEPRTTRIRASKEEHAEMLKKGLVFTLDVPVKKPGGYQLRVVVRDTASKRVGSAMQFITVPDLKKGRLTLSGISLLPERPDAGGGTPARRIFTPGSTLVYGYQILNARLDSGNKAQLDAQVRLFSNGQEIYEANAQQLNQDKRATNSKNVDFVGRLQLPSLAPGPYVLQVVVADNNRSDNYAMAWNAIDFEVR